MLQVLPKNVITTDPDVAIANTLARIEFIMRANGCERIKCQMNVFRGIVETMSKVSKMKAWSAIDSIHDALIDCGALKVNPHKPLHDGNGVMVLSQTQILMMESYRS